MNCSSYQERLDERLDLLRARVQDGSVSRADVRAQGVAALQEIVRDCSECEGELRTHLNVRLALLDSDPESIIVPPELRLNVRRALDRDRLVPQRASSRPSWMGFVWTGGSVFLAIGLFIVARPLLIEQAQKPVMAPSSEAPASSATESGIAPQITPALPTQKYKETTPAKNGLAQGKATSKPSGAVSPSTLTAPRAQRTQRPVELQSTQKPPVHPSVRLAVPPPPAVSPKMPATSGNRNSQNSTSTVAQTPPRSKPTASGRKQNSQDKLLSSASPATAPRLFRGAPAPAAQDTASSGASEVKPRVAIPDAAQLQAKSTTLRDEDLGLEVHFIPERANRFMAKNGFGGNAGSAEVFAGNAGGGGGFGGNAGGAGGFGGANPNAANDSAESKSPPLGVPESPAPAAAAPGRRARDDENGARRSVPSTNTPGAQNATKSQNNPRNSASLPDKRSDSAPTNSTSSVSGVGALKNNERLTANEARANNARVQQRNRASATSEAPPFVAVSVLSAVSNARIMGRIKAKSEQEMLLWTGNLEARQQVSVSLAPLGIASKDEIEISVEQQISPSQTNKLATTTLVAP